MRVFLVFLLVFSFYSCTKNGPQFTQVTIEEVFSDSLYKIRALQAKDKENIWFSAGEGRVGVLQNKIPKLASIRYNETVLKFKSLSVQDQMVYFLHPTQPAIVYKLEYEASEARHIESIYLDEDADVFINAIGFWDTERGILVGEREGVRCLEIVWTQDGGNTWKKVECKDLPQLEDGEVLFAASNSNISLYGSHVWIATGGTKSRILHSADYGETWQIYSTPFIQGGPGMGIFTIDFMDENHGVAMGGKWEDKTFNAGNKAYTKDGGKTWKLFSNNEYPGLQNQVAFVPHPSKKSIVSIGEGGIAYTHNAKDWVQLSDKKLEHIYFIAEDTAYASAGGNLYKLLFY